MTPFKTVFIDVISFFLFLYSSYFLCCAFACEWMLVSSERKMRQKFYKPIANEPRCALPLRRKSIQKWTGKLTEIATTQIMFNVASIVSWIDENLHAIRFTINESEFEMRIWFQNLPFHVSINQLRTRLLFVVFVVYLPSLALCTSKRATYMPSSPPTVPRGTLLYMSV